MIYDAWLARHRAPRAGAADHALLKLLAHTASERHDGRVVMTYNAIGRMIGRSWSAVQRMVHRLAAAGWLQIDPRRGYANIYRVLFDWVKRQVEGEKREQPTPREFAALGTEPAPAPDSIAFRWPNLDHHPRL